MRKNRCSALLVVLIISTLVGCQSGMGWTSRLAWWKTDGAPSDISVAARSASPELPSQAAIAQSAVADATTPYNYAATTSPAQAMGQAPAYNYAATAPQTGSYPPTNPTYPTANYATNPTAPPSGAAPQSQAVASTTPGYYPTTPPTQQAPQQNYAQQGAYDPGSYQAMASQSTPSSMDSLASQANSSSPASDERYDNAGQSASDRYAMAPTSYGSQAPSQPAAANSYAYGAAPPTAPPVNTATPTNPAMPPQSAQDRYAMANSESPSAGAYDPMAYNPSAPATPNMGSAAPASAPGTAPSWPASGTQVADASASPGYSGVQPVRLETPAGQYRPAGTTSYSTANSPYGQVNVATRPESSGSQTNGGNDLGPQATYPYYSPNTNTPYGAY